MARPEGVEPPTSGTANQRSIQLSYGRTIGECRIIAKRGLNLLSVSYFFFKFFIFSGGLFQVSELLRVVTVVEL